jgi:hypothetical protein
MVVLVVMVCRQDTLKIVLCVKHYEKWVLTLKFDFHLYLISLILSSYFFSPGFFLLSSTTGFRCSAF